VPERPRAGRTGSMTRFPFLVVVAVLALPALAARADTCLTPLAEHEPLCSPALSPEAWPISHHGPYAQGSSPFPGPRNAAGVVAEHLLLTGPPITLATSPAYADGGVAVWGAELGLSNAVFKLDHDTFSVIDAYVPAAEEPNPPAIPLGVSGAYSVADADFHFLLGRARFLEIFGDAVPGDRSSDIALLKRTFLPDSAFCRTTDVLVGGVMLPDGHLAFVTEQASVGVVPSDVVGLDAANVVSLPSENGANCDDPGIPDAGLETVSNSIAADEDGGFYVVTDAAVIKYHWDGTALRRIWRTGYDSDPPFSLLRLGPGSGSTPSLMGTAQDDDRFVVITDGRELMHLVLLWRDDIPPGWQPIAPGKDPRVACEVPITFGDRKTARTLSEQSVLVRGHAAVVVNNLLGSEEGIGVGIPALDAALAALEGGNPAVAPHGIERVDWDPRTRTCAPIWTNAKISLPNAIPTMSAASDLIYAIGQRDGAWGLEAIDFRTGESAFVVPSAQRTCPQQVIDTIAGSPLAPFLLPVIERLPASCENSIFAATEVGPDGSIYTGTFQGVSRFTPAAVLPSPPRRRAVAGVGQGDDLAARALTSLASNGTRAADAAARGVLQLDATLLAVDEAATTAKIDQGSSTTGHAAVTSARAHFATARDAIGSNDTLAAAELTAAQSDLSTARSALAPCPPAPRAGCRSGGRSKLTIVQRGRDADSLSWQLRSSEPTSRADFGDPTTTTDVSLCLYADGRSVAELHVPAASGWTASAKSMQYDGKGIRGDGVRKVVLQARDEAGARLRVKGKGRRLPVLGLPLAAPLTVQLVNLQTGVCWERTFTAPDVRRSDALKLRAEDRRS
jgi:hypothetical protein